MKWADTYLQKARIAKTLPYLRSGDRVLDIGSSQGELFESFRTHDPRSIGLDPEAAARTTDTYELKPGYFPAAALGLGTFDAVVMLAVLEHAPASDLTLWASTIQGLLNPGGRLIATVPSPLVDPILDIAMKFRLIDGMETEQHYGFDPKQTESLMVGAGLSLITKKTFQFGLNNLYVFGRLPERSHQVELQPSRDMAT
jgi:2-polyprenyl-3-methyl-5-hydroxy-6-metoxy-1,4-benzoquinol methylase